MRIVHVTLIFFICIIHVHSQKFIYLGMIGIPKRKFSYFDSKTQKYSTATVQKFYINEFPESIGQYQKYLAALKQTDSDEEWEDALPREKNLQVINLTTSQIEFLRNAYFLSGAFLDYPIIGLEYDQIRKYLEWKFENSIQDYLLSHHIQKPDQLSAGEFWYKQMDSLRLDRHSEYLLPLEAILFSAFQFKQK